MDIKSVSSQGVIPVDRLSNKNVAALVVQQPAPAVAQVPAEDVRNPSREELQKAVASVESFTQSIRRDLKFSMDDESGKVVVKVTDSKTGEVIRQMPSEEALKLAQRLEEARSLLFKAEA
ncbi:flagellar protein FlaG [Pseudomonas seleniipraecipitans]|uniref:Flagellar protein FlaG n=1 Tax=Phytopseudomonas seleniipraecipitans TaxID=640205 RepID=A0ABY5JA89_9GAMM|nr:flagellar protein FlaG [Pseudomonas seleniipraecipitans]UUD64972.1 flagellar protein FlaG [Pseudomonas seleniipraecipitans]